MGSGTNTVGGSCYQNESFNIPMHNTQQLNHKKIQTVKTLRCIYIVAYSAKMVILQFREIYS